MAQPDLSDVFSVTSNVDNRLLEEETADDSKQIEAAFSDDQRKPWIQRFMKNDNYTIDASEKGETVCSIPLKWLSLRSVRLRA